MAKKRKKDNQTNPNKIGSGKAAEKKLFVAFTALPRPLRKQEFGYEDAKEFAEANHVNPGTLSEWKKDSGFWEEVRTEWRKWGKDRTPNVIAGLYKKAVNEGNASEALAWMKIIEEWQEKSTVKVESEELKKLTEQMRKIAEKK